MGGGGGNQIIQGNQVNFQVILLILLKIHMIQGIQQNVWRGGGNQVIQGNQVNIQVILLILLNIHVIQVIQ